VPYLHSLLCLVQAVYTVLREAEHRSTAPLAYWDLPGAKLLVPRQRRCQEALKIVNDCLDGLIARCKALVRPHVDAFLTQHSAVPVSHCGGKASGRGEARLRHALVLSPVYPLIREKART
jgi:hypothetical protein